MLPDPDDELLVAELTFEPSDDPSADELELSVAIEHRVTSRVPFDGEPLRTDVLVVIQRSAYEEGASLRAVQPSDRSQATVIELVRRAEAIAAEDMVARHEESAWTALEHALLVAATYFVQASFATTVLENPTTRHDLRQTPAAGRRPHPFSYVGSSSLACAAARRAIGTR